MNASVSGVSRGNRTKESNMCAIFSRFSPDSKHGPKSLEARPKESKHACQVSRADGDGRSCGSLVKTQASARVDVLFCSTDQGVQHVCKFFHEKAWICARRTTHHADEKQEKEEK